MIRTTATEARKNWFQLLDEVVAGEEVMVERRGHQLVLTRRDASSSETQDIPSYDDLIKASDEVLDGLDRQGWEWVGPGQPLEFRNTSKS